jgi:hypothetical protein
VAFRTLLIIGQVRSLLNVAVFFDVLLAGTCLAPGYYLVRTLRQIYSYEELSMLKYEWIPVLMAGIFFVMWVGESSYFEYVGQFSSQINLVEDATLFASVSIFAIATARFAETWGGYVKGINVKRRMLSEGQLQQELVEEQAPHAE